MGYEHANVVWTVGIRGFAGSTPTGIIAGEGGFVGTVEGRLGSRVRLGGGGHASLFDWGRVTTGAAVTHATGLFFRASVDVVRFDDSPHAAALVLVGTFGADLVLGTKAAPVLWGPSIGAGARF